MTYLLYRCLRKLLSTSFINSNSKGQQECLQDDTSDVCRRHPSGVQGNGAGQEVKRGGHGDHCKQRGVYDQAEDVGRITAEFDEFFTCRPFFRDGT